jgi:hypothetical protein
MLNDRTCSAFIVPRSSFLLVPDFGLICGTRRGSLPLLPSGPGGVHEHPSHRARSLTWPFTSFARSLAIDSEQHLNGSTRDLVPSTFLPNFFATTLLTAEVSLYTMPDVP